MPARVYSQLVHTSARDYHAGHPCPDLKIGPAKPQYVVYG